MSNKRKLTKRIIEEVIPDPTKRLLIWDTGITGFCVRIYPSGKKTYFFQYRNSDRQTKFIKIGVHGNMTTEIARDHARQIALRISMGGDPSTEKKEHRDKPMIANLIHDYLEGHAKKKRASSVLDDKRIIKSIIEPTFKNMKVESISKKDIEQMHTKMSDRPYFANRALALLSKMFSLAVGWGWRSDNPVNGIQRYQEMKRDRWLQGEELERFLKVLEQYPDHTIALLIKFLLLTGAQWHLLGINSILNERYGLNHHT